MLSKQTVLTCAAIALPLLLGLGIRLTGIQHGKPDMVYHPDVAKQTLVARHVYHGGLDIRALFKDDFTRTLYPYGTAVMLGNIAKLGGSRMDDVHRWRWALRMRYLATGLITMAYLILLIVLSQRLRPSLVFLSGLVLLTEPLNAQFSHYGMNDVPLLAFMLITAALSVLMEREKTIPTWSLLCGLCAGAAFAVKYQGLLALAFPGIVWLWLVRKRTAKTSIISVITVAAGFFIAVAGLCPLLRDDPAYFFGTFGEFMAWQGNIMGQNTPLSVKAARNVGALGTVIVARGFILIIPLTAFGIAYAWKERRKGTRPAAAAASLTIGFILLTAILVSRDMVRQNDMIPLAAFLLLPCIIFLEEMSRFHRHISISLLCLLALVFTLVSVADAAALSREDTRMLARQWSDENLAPDLTVAYERYTLPPTRADLKLRRAKFLGDAESRRLVTEQQADVYIISSLAYSRFFDKFSPYFSKETQRVYDALNEKYELIADFKDRPLLYGQPRIKIYGRKETP